MFILAGQNKTYQMSKVNKLAEKVKAAGMPIILVSEPSDLEDGMIEVIKDKLHLQVGHNYFCVVEQFEGGLFQFGGTIKTQTAAVAELFTTYQKAI